MKEKPTPTTKLFRSAWAGVIGGWVIAVLFAVSAVASIYLRSKTAGHWSAQQVEPLQRDCLSALASSPPLSERFQRVCALFNFATSTAEDFMLWVAFLSVVIAFLGVGLAEFARKVLKHLKLNGIHNHTLDGIRHPTDVSSKPLV